VTWKNSVAKLKLTRYYKKDGRPWIYAEILSHPDHPRFTPSLCDLGRILHGIAECEDESYPPPAKGRIRTLQFLRDVINLRTFSEREFQRLSEKYQIPEREGNRIVNTNGARSPNVTRQLNDSDIDWGF
jgi:hypothetical protein